VNLLVKGDIIGMIENVKNILQSQNILSVELSWMIVLNMMNVKLKRNVKMIKVIVKMMNEIVKLVKKNVRRNVKHVAVVMMMKSVKQIVLIIKHLV